MLVVVEVEFAVAAVVAAVVAAAVTAAAAVAVQVVHQAMEMENGALAGFVLDYTKSLQVIVVALVERCYLVALPGRPPRDTGALHDLLLAGRSPLDSGALRDLLLAGHSPCPHHSLPCVLSHRPGRLVPWGETTMQVMQAL